MILTILEGPSGQPGSERRRYLQIGLLALALLLVAVLGFRQVQRWMTPKKEVWVAAANLPAGSTLGSESLKKLKLAESALPRGVVLDARALAGRELARPKQEGSPFTSDDFARAAVSRTAVAEMIPEGRVLATLRVGRGLVPYKNLKNGDRVDIVTVGGRGGSGFARVIAHDAYLVGMLVPVEPKPAAAPTGRAALIPPAPTRTPVATTVGLLLALHPEHALPVTQAASSRQPIQVVLHGKTEVASGQLIELPERRPVELIAGSRKGQLTVMP
jgi:Flp pilus assembly protein CpaB